MQLIDPHISVPDLPAVLRQFFPGIKTSERLAAQLSSFFSENSLKVCEDNAFRELQKTSVVSHILFSLIDLVMKNESNLCHPFSAHRAPSANPASSSTCTMYTMTVVQYSQAVCSLRFHQLAFSCVGWQPIRDVSDEVHTRLSTISTRTRVSPSLFL